MRTKKLGNSDMSITAIGLGTWAMGGGNWAYGWGDQDDAESVRTIEKAVELGINWLDTAPIYGLGHSESIVGKALSTLGDERKPYVFTKIGMHWDDKMRVQAEMVPEKVEETVDGSLKRLGIDAIDLLQIHWPTPDDKIEATWEAMLKVRDKGKVRYVGVCNFDDGQLKRISELEKPTSNQPPFNLLQQQILTATAPYCLEHGIGLIPYSPMLSGLLTGKFNRDRAASLSDNDWRSGLPLLLGSELDRFLTLVNRLKAMANERGTTLANLSIAWVLKFEAVTGAIVGARRPDQIRETIRAADITLDPEFEATIDEAVEGYGTRTVKLL